MQRIRLTHCGGLPVPLSTVAMPGLRKRLAVAAIVLLPFLCGSRFVQQVQLRIEGFLGAAADQVKPWAMVQVQIGNAEPRPFALLNIITLNGGGPTGADILERVMPIHPNFILDANPELLAKMSSAQPNQYLKITGWSAFGPQRVLVSQVELSEPITGPTPTPSLRKKLLGF